MLGGVFQQVRQCLGGPFQVADAEKSLRAIHLQLHPAFQIKFRQTARRPLEHLPGGMLLLFKGHHSRVQPGKTQQRLHQPADAAGLGLNLVKGLLRVPGRQLLPQKIALQQNGGKGRAQLVGDVAQAVRQKALVRLQRRCLLLQDAGNFVKIVLQGTQFSRGLAAEPGRLAPGVDLGQIFRQLPDAPVPPQGVYRSKGGERPAKQQCGSCAGHTPGNALANGRGRRQGQHDRQHPVKFPAMHPAPPPSGSPGPAPWQCASRSPPPAFPAAASR